MISFKNNQNNRQTTKNYDMNMNMNHFGNDWGLFVDIEKQKINLPNNHEVLRERYSIQIYNYGEICHDIENSFEPDMDFDDLKTDQNQCMPLVIKASTTTTIVLILTYVILVVL